MEVNISVQLNTGTATSSIPNFKYNKSKQIIMEFDDAAATSVTAFSKLQQTFYTDGCGNNKNYGLGLAVNGRNQYDNVEMGLSSTWATYSQRAAMIPYGLDIMNHSYYHEPDGNFNYGSDVVRNVTELNAMILANEAYQMNCLIVPTAETGFMTAAANLGYIGGGSEGTFDTFTPEGLYNPQGSITNLPASTYQAIRREFSDTWDNTGSQWDLMNNLMASGAIYNFFEIGTHGLYTPDAIANFNSWIDSIVTQSNDTTIFSSLREFLEYNHIRQHVTKTETIVGNVLNIKLDYSSVPNQNIRWFDTSLLLSEGTISSVTVDDSSFNVSYNPATKLVNVAKQKQVWGTITPPDPSTVLWRPARRYFVATVPSTPTDPGEDAINAFFDNRYIAANSLTASSVKVTDGDLIITIPDEIGDKPMIKTAIDGYPTANLTHDGTHYRSAGKYAQFYNETGNKFQSAFFTESKPWPRLHSLVAIQQKFNTYEASTNGYFTYYIGDFGDTTIRIRGEAATGEPAVYTFNVGFPVRQNYHLLLTYEIDDVGVKATLWVNGVNAGVAYAVDATRLDMPDHEMGPDTNSQNFGFIEQGFKYGSIPSDADRANLIALIQAKYNIGGLVQLPVADNLMLVQSGTQYTTSYTFSNPLGFPEDVSRRSIKYVAINDHVQTGTYLTAVENMMSWNSNDFPLPANFTLFVVEAIVYDTQGNVFHIPERKGVTT
ncbi:hypothetical protein [Pedobacter sp. L105]|uniref:hypothetical protein n=1 Tax=Pedobacter sp. L105 TaxID=1641871 RepID=UPI00131D4583|nr:hypothetical protein [Pedobacter sp. L105]